MSVITEEDKVLLQKAASFDESALAEIYDRYQNPLYRYAMRLLGNQQLAEDCISDTFLRFLQSLRNGSVPGESLQAYLYRIAHNWIVDHYRKDFVTAVNQESDFPDGQENLENRVFSKLEGDKIRAAIFSLTPLQQQVIMLKYFEGWQNEEIAIAIKKNVGAVKALAHRSLRVLRKMLEKKE